MAAVEDPGAAQDTGSDVEQSIRQAMHQRREIQQVCGFFVDFDGLPAEALIRATMLLAKIAAELVFDAPGAGSDGFDDFARYRFLGYLREHLARASHGAETADPQAAIARQSLKW
jgi:hypothetical protein